MAFEKKILSKTTCPRCNAIAELRIDVKEPSGSFLFIYIVCNICRLKRYYGTTTKKALKIQKSIDILEEKLKTYPPDSPARTSILAKIKDMKIKKSRAEVGIM